VSTAASAASDTIEGTSTNFNKIADSIDTLSHSAERIGNIGMVFDPRGKHTPSAKIIERARHARTQTQKGRDQFKYVQSKAERAELEAAGLDPDQVGAANYRILREMEQEKREIARSVAEEEAEKKRLAAEAAKTKVKPKAKPKTRRRASSRSKKYRTITK
jgi:hypothetical protein